MSSRSRTIVRPARRGRGPRPDPRVRAVACALAGLAGAGGGLALPPVATAQEVPPEMAMVRLQGEYEAARLSCEGAVRAREALQPEYELLIQQAGRADPESDAWQAAQSELLPLTLRIDNQQRRVTEVCGEAETARRAYLEGLDAVRRDLESELVATSSPARRQDVQALLTDIENRYGELEREGGGLAEQLVMRPVIDIDPRNTPDDVRRKAALLENLIAMADSTLVTLQEEVERLEARRRSRQLRENFSAGISRFGDTRTPVGTDPREGDESAGVAPDSTALSGGSLEERIEALHSAELNLQYYRERMEERLGEFRAYLRRTTL